MPVKKYFLNKKPLLVGSFSVHQNDCPFIPADNQRIYLGEYDFCGKALSIANLINPDSEGCYFCMKECSQAPGNKYNKWESFNKFPLVYSRN